MGDASDKGDMMEFFFGPALQTSTDFCRNKFVFNPLLFGRQNTLLSRHL